MYQQIQDLLDKIGSYPEKPKKPVLPAKHTAEMAGAHAVNMEVFESEFDVYDKARDTYLLSKGRIEHEIAEMISEGSGLNSIPEQYRGKVWNLAHSKTDNHYDAYLFLCELVEIFE
jgi:hypothetical protein